MRAAGSKRIAIGRRSRSFIVVALALAILNACGSVRYDLPYEHGYPTVRLIVDRIRCELVEMVKDGPSRNFPDGFPHRDYLRRNNFVAAMTLSLEVTRDGALEPSLEFPVPPALSIGGKATVSRSRTQEFSVDLSFYLAELYSYWKDNNAFGMCEQPGRNLAGDLGLQETVLMAFTAADTADEPGKAFGGSVRFNVSRGVSSVGPTWTFERFVGPGGLVSASKSYEDKLTFAFGRGEPRQSVVRSAEDMRAARAYVDRLLLADAN